MHLELVELLRCPNAHAPGVLVAAANQIDNRYVLSGLLGCPECLAEYAVQDGVTHFANHHGHAHTDVAADSPHVGAAAADSIPDAAVDRDVAMRLAAQLGLSAGSTVYALIGYRVEMAVSMREIVAARVVVINPPGPMRTGQPLALAAQVAPLGVALCGQTIPLVARKFDGIAVAPIHASSAMLEQCVQLLRPNARLVAPSPATVPAGMRELVRDEQVWVAEKEAVASAPVSIRRR